MNRDQEAYEGGSRIRNKRMKSPNIWSIHYREIATLLTMGVGAIAACSPICMRALKVWAITLDEGTKKGKEVGESLLPLQWIVVIEVSA